MGRNRGRKKRRNLPSSRSTPEGSSTVENTMLTEEESAEVEEACRSLQQEFAESIPKLRKWSVNDFNLCSNIGEGRFGKVYTAILKETECQVAIKVIDRNQIEKDGMGQQLLNEIIIHSNARHKYIVPLITFFGEGEYLYLVMQLEKSGSLYDLMEGQPLRKVLQELVAKFISQIAQALLFLHSNNFIHRDIKPENILLDEDFNAKLADFGWSIPVDLHPREICGTVDYMAPEMLKNQVYGVTVDHWCLGILCFELINGFSPFQTRSSAETAQNDFKTFKKILKGRYECPKDMPPGAQDLVSKLLKSNPNQRLSLESVIQHTWIKALYCAEST